MCDIENATFICLDTETTGLSCNEGGRICEVALLASRGAARVGSFTTLLNPQVFIAPEISAIHGITNEMVKNSPTFKDISIKLQEMLEGCVLICHNADFDVSFLSYEFANCGLKMPNITILDTLKYARCHGAFSRNRLGIIAQELGFSAQGWHRAMADTIMTEKIFYRFLQEFKNHGAKTVKDLFDLQTKKIGIKIKGEYFL